MENSRKLSNKNLSERVANVLSPVLPPGGTILLGLSGGVDSVVLLHLLQQLSPQHSWRLSALHIHHGISPHADAWATLCADLCLHYNIPLQIEQVNITPLRAMGIEAAARKLRHEALARQPVDVVALAHHRDDQVETLLLQLLRGAGVRGASAMPTVKQRTHSPILVRPMLDVPRSALLGYAQQHGLQWVEDESNADDAYPRNFLRHRVLPMLEQRFPAYRDTLARSAQHFTEASEMLDELAQMDAQNPLLLGEGVGKGHGATLAMSRLQSLSPARAKNLLRYFLYQCSATMPQAVQLDTMLQQLCDARPDAGVCISYGDWQVRRYQGEVYVLRALGEFDPNLILPWLGEAELDWPALNTRLSLQQSLGLGISLAKLQRAPVTLRLRSGGETLRPQPNAATRTLKNLLQEQRVPPWLRERLPLLYCGDEVVSVAGIAIAEGYQAVANEMGISIDYLDSIKTT